MNRLLTAERSIADLIDVSGKTAVVTGGAMGIGEAIAAPAPRGGANVVVADRAAVPAHEVVARRRPSRPSCLTRLGLRPLDARRPRTHRQLCE